MYINDDQSAHSLSLKGCQFTSDESDHVLQLFIREVKEFLQGLGVFTLHNFVDRRFNTSRPHDLVNS